MVPSTVLSALDAAKADVIVIAAMALFTVVVCYAIKKMGDAVGMPPIERSSHKEYHDAARWSETARRKNG